MHTATATAPQTPSREQVAAAWACLAACWGVQQLVVQQHMLAVSAVSDEMRVIGAADAEADATEHLSAALQQLSAKVNSSSVEVDAAKVQYVASTALAEACHAAQQAVTAAAALQSSNSPTAAMQHHGPATSSSSAGNVPSTDAPATRLHALQMQLAALQAAMGEFEQSGLSFILDPSTSALSDELPEAAFSLEDLIDAGEAEQAAAVLREQQAAADKQHWQQRLSTTSVQLQLLPQLLLAVQYEALGPIAAWHAAAAAGAHDAHGQHEQLVGLAVLPAGAVSQQQLWQAAAAHLQQHWQQLQLLLLQAMELEGCMHMLAAVAAAGGAAAIWPEDVDLMSQAISLQQMLLPQGFDILTTDECVASAQLLQVQWTDLEQRLWLALAEALGPMLGLQGMEGLQGQQGGQQGAGSSVLVLRQLLDAAAGSIAGGSIMHCQDVLEALAAGPASNTGGSSGSMGSSSSVWGVPGVSDAWGGLVLLLLQYGCLQQQLLTPQQAAKDLDLAAAGVDGSGLDVLRSCKALPLEVEAQRPLFVAVQVMHELLCGQGQQHAAAATGPSVSLQQHVEGIMLAPVLQQVGSSLHQELGSLQRHLSVLASEAQGVLSRNQPQHPQQEQQPVDVNSSTTGHMQDGVISWGDANAAIGDGADLVPFDAFDMLLPGADMLLEDLRSGEGSDTGADRALEGDQQGSIQRSDTNPAAAAAAGLPDLLPYDAFDDGLEGAGMLLEDGGLDGGSEGSEAEAGAGGFFGDLTGGDSDLLGGALADEQPAVVAQQRLGSDMQGAQGAARAPDAEEAEARALVQLLMAAGQQLAAAALRQQQLVGLQHVQGSCTWQQQVWLRHLAAFEWLWGDMLPQQSQEGEVARLVNEQHQLVHATAIALGLQAQESGPDTTPGKAYQLYCSGLSEQLPSRPKSCQPRINSSSGDGTDQEQQQQEQQQRMPSSVELLQAWQALCEHQAALADALQAWRTACTAAASAVADVLLGAPGAPADVPALQVTDPTVCRKVSHTLEHSYLCTCRTT
jgi:hypothetical protein